MVSRQTLTAPERNQLIRFSSFIVALHVAGWGSVFWYARDYPFLVGLAALAYSFGLRHAFDADHIAAIDNTTRRFMIPPADAGPAGHSRAARPFGVGFYFSLGHSTVVFALTIAIALAARAVAAELPQLQAIGSLVGPTVSGVFLYVIGILNLIVMIDVFRVFQAMRRGQFDAAELEARLLRRGVISRWFGGLFRLVKRPRQMYWVGLLFGLGFDTATEVGLLTTAGIAASQALPLLAVLSLPVVFAAGMCLMDSADGVMMCGAYGWALDKPLRKVFYNLTVTGLSGIVALLIGTLQLVSIVTDRFLGIHHGVWGAIQQLDMQTMGYGVAGLFLLSWMASAAVWRFGRMEERS